MTCNSIKLKSVKKTSTPNPVESHGYIKSYSSSGPRPIKSPSDSIRYSSQKICNWSRRPKTIPEIKNITLFLVINNPITYKFFKDFTNRRKKTNSTIVFSCRYFPSILKYRDHRWNLENKTPSDTYWRVQLVCVKVQIHNSLEPPLL